jgi:transcriptional regulator with XRE-family HTH domain
MTMTDRPARQTLSRLDSARLIREARELAGLSQAELAALIRSRQPVISRWERGLESPRVDTLARILEACGFEADLVFRRHDDVDRSQVVQQLAMTPRQRIEGVRNVSRFVGAARRVEPVTSSRA